MADHAVAKPNAAWLQMMETLELIHDLMGGTGRMRQAGLKWLPREQAEVWESWHARLHRSILYNSLSRTVHAMAGHALTGDLVFDGTDQRLVQLMQNCDGQGMSLRQLASQLLQLIIRDGGVHILIDQDENGGRPYVVVVEAVQMIAETRGGKDHGYEQVRIKETSFAQVNRFEQQKIEQIRVLEKNKFEIWQDNDNHQWEMVKKGPMDIDEVPLVSLRLGVPLQGWVRPPLMDLAWLNLAHWQSSSDQRHILHIARVPILFARAIGHHDAPIGGGWQIPNHAVTSPDRPCARFCPPRPHHRQRPF